MKLYQENLKLSKKVIGSLSQKNDFSAAPLGFQLIIIVKKT